MKNTLKLNHENRTIVMDRTFAKRSENTRSEEYAHLQQVRQDYPTYDVIRRQIRTNPKKESYKGLTYEYMEDYILTHESKETVNAVLAEFKELKVISKCHSRSRRYAPIKRWFLDKYPDIEKFGMDKASTANPDSTEDSGYETVLPPLNNADPLPLAG